MPFDPRKLTPAPWHYGGCKSHADESGLSCSQVRDQRGDVVPKNEVGQFAADARNAFDVMMRRGWYPVLDMGRWYISGENAARLDGTSFGEAHNDLAAMFTALIEADKWYAASVEKANVPTNT